MASKQQQAAKQKHARALVGFGGQQHQIPREGWTLIPTGGQQRRVLSTVER